MGVKAHRHQRKPWADRLPEFTHYRDDGCAVHSACLTCPLPSCVYDDPRQGRGAAIRLRDAEIMQRFHEGWSPARLAKHFGIHPRSIFRVLRRARES